MVKGIFFDLDGTLCQFQGDFKKIFIDCCSPVFDTQAIPYDLILNLWKRFLNQEEQLTAGIILQKICSELNIPLVSNYLEIADLFSRTYASHVVPVIGVNDMLRVLSKNYRLALISNGPMDMQSAVIKTLGIGELFDVILISGDPNVLYRKPNPLIFQMALEKTQMQKEDVLMVGDNFKVDIEGAENSGIKTLFIGKNEDSKIRSNENILSLVNILEKDFS